MFGTRTVKFGLHASKLTPGNQKISKIPAIPPNCHKFHAPHCPSKRRKYSVKLFCRLQQRCFITARIQIAQVRIFSVCTTLENSFRNTGLRKLTSAYSNRFTHSNSCTFTPGRLTKRIAVSNSVDLTVKYSIKAVVHNGILFDKMMISLGFLSVSF